ncbi:MAG TPA: hypothetical protein VGN42_03515 [Pirellulales bacterium]|jgi:sec-independent protein translocase protein TatC|nr:hypothetical protein [Pirellulales bacterium]
MDENPYKSAQDENPYKSPQDELLLPEAINWRGPAGQLFELRNWRLGVLVCFVTAALVTPADPYSIFIVAIPLSAIYFAIAGFMTWFNRRRKALASAETPDD